MRSLIVFVALVAACSAGGMVPKKMLKEIMAINFMKTCWGEDAMGQFFQEMETAYDKCSKQVISLTEDLTLIAHSFTLFQATILNVIF